MEQQSFNLNDRPVVNFSLLPKDALMRIVLKLEIRDVAKAALVSKQFCDAVKEDSLWQEFAERRYGSHVTSATKHLYDTYKEMMQDDNRRGALPTLRGTWESRWKYNNSHRFPDRFYCCTIVGIQWHRPSNKLLLYLDARGERDLSSPNQWSVDSRR